MTSSSQQVLLEKSGILDEVFAGCFRHELPALLHARHDDPMEMSVSSVGDAPRVLWSEQGPLHRVLRSFRLNYLRYLGPMELKTQILLKVALLPAQMHEFIEPEDDPLPSARVIDTQGGESAPLPARPQPLCGPLLSRLHPIELPLGLKSAPKPALAPPKIALSLTPPAAQPESTPPAEPGQAETAALPASDQATEPAQPVAKAETAAVQAPPSATEPEAVVAEAPGDGASAPAGPVAPRPRPATPKGLQLPGNFYKDYFCFERMPFNNTPDSFFYYPTDKHQEALSRLIYAIAERKGFVMISGEIGAGKSTLCRTLLAQLPNKVHTALVTHTHLSAEQLLQAIGEDLGLSVRGLSRFDILQKLNEYLIEQLAQDNTVCIIIDEAQNLSPEVLEEVRMISNLETEEEKLVQLILLGQPELREKIDLPQMKQLRQRIAVQYHLEPLSRGETLGYIEHRLKTAAPAEPLHFTHRAMKAVHAYSGGVPRLINTICDNALLTAFTQQSRRITPRMIHEAGRDLGLRPTGGGWWWWR